MAHIAKFRSDDNVTCICVQGEKVPENYPHTVGGDSCCGGDGTGRSGRKWKRRNCGFDSIYSCLRFFTEFCNLKKIYF